jgi:prepilin-type processing-associated H-X9-DG protein
MTDEDLIGYLLDALAPADRAAAEARLAADPAAAARLGRWRAALAPLAADRPAPVPPPGLADRALARVAAAAGPDRPPVFPAPPRAPRDVPDSAGVGGRFLRADLVVAGGIALFAFGLVVSGVGKVRARSELVACRDNLRTLHAGLTKYADTRAGRYPQVPAGAPAGTFAATLTDAGCVPAGFRPACPADRAGGPVRYTYSLGYREPGGALVGPHRPPAGGEHDLVPISADLPTPEAAPAAGPVSPHAGGMNVLYAGGHVRFTTSPHVGPGGDHIFQNLFGGVGAGCAPADTVLGRPADVP